MSSRALAVRGLMVAVLVIVAVPTLVEGTTSTRRSSNLAWDARVDRQAGRSTASPRSTTARTYSDVPGLALGIGAKGRVTVTVSALLQGAPVELRVFESHPGGPVGGRSIQPGAVTIRPSSQRFLSFTWTTSSTSSCSEFLSLQWRSVTGERVTMRKGVIQTLYRTPNHPPDVCPA